MNTNYLCLILSFIIGFFINFIKNSIWVTFILILWIILVNYLKNKKISYLLIIQKIILSWLLIFVIKLVINNRFNAFYWYLIVMIFYHNLEFYFILIYRYEQLNNDSFLIFHSREYFFITNLVFLECLYNYYYNNIFEKYFYISILGLIFMIVGLIIRSSSYFYAKKNFSHKMKYYKEKNHQLITTGIYSYERHPSYLGFFIFSISGQILLLNKFNVIIFFIILKKFFKNRISIEEEYLKMFFGMKYINYMKNTKTFINIYKN